MIGPGFSTTAGIGGVASESSGCRTVWEMSVTPCAPEQAAPAVIV